MRTLPLVRTPQPSAQATARTRRSDGYSAVVQFCTACPSTPAWCFAIAAYTIRRRVSAAEEDLRRGPGLEAIGRRVSLREGLVGQDLA